MRTGGTDAGPKRVSISELRDAYEEWSRANKRPRTVLNDKGRLDAFFADVVVSTVNEITTQNVERFLSKRALAGAQPATVLRYREILHALMAFAKRMGMVEKNPVSDVSRPKLPRHEPRFLSLDQIDELLAAVDGDLVAPLVSTIVFAGLRREEACWLTWNDIDSDPACIRVRAKTVDEESWLPKTKIDRAVPISSRLQAILASQTQNGVMWRFPSPEGKRWDPDNLSRRFRKLMKAARLPWNMLDLRHTFGSQLARKGVSELKIATLMGNSPEIARRHYIRLIPAEMAVDVEF